MGIVGRPNLKKNIADMVAGDKAYTLPSALVFDMQSVGYVDISTDVCEEKSDPFSMPIERTGTKPGDYRVKIKGLNEVWRRRQIPADSVCLIKLEYEPDDGELPDGQLNEGDGKDIADAVDEFFRGNPPP